MNTHKWSNTMWKYSLFVKGSAKHFCLTSQMLIYAKYLALFSLFFQQKLCDWYIFPVKIFYYDMVMMGCDNTISHYWSNFNSSLFVPFFFSCSNSCSFLLFLLCSFSFSFLSWFWGPLDLGPNWPWGKSGTASRKNFVRNHICIHFTQPSITKKHSIQDILFENGGQKTSFRIEKVVTWPKFEKHFLKRIFKYNPTQSRKIWIHLHFLN